MQRSSVICTQIHQHNECAVATKFHTRLIWVHDVNPAIKIMWPSAEQQPPHFEQQVLHIMCEFHRFFHHRLILFFLQENGRSVFNRATFELNPFMKRMKNEE